MTGSRKRITQQDIARMTGVSQATVSIVLNGRTDTEVRIAPETRERVLDAIRRTGYVADPIARRLADRHNRILGVFTYEPVFPAGSGDFYHAFLLGIEQSAERLGCDLLLLTSAPVTDGRRRIFHEGNRMRLADGCILLGRSVDPEELARLLAEGQSFVSVGRRDDAGGPVPSVGADYPAATAEAVRRATALGHRRLAYVGEGAGPESFADRFRGFADATGRSTPKGATAKATGRNPAGRAAAGGAAERTMHLPGGSPGEILDILVAEGITVALVEEYADAAVLAALARERGLDIPGDLSLLALGDPTRPAPTDIDFSGYRIPREQMGRRATELLTELITGEINRADARELLPCEPVEGVTLTAPKR